MSEVLLRTEHLTKHFKTNAGVVHAVDDVSLCIEKGKTLGVVGESGCGKSTFGRSVLRLIEPTSGAVYFQDKNVLECTPQEMKALRQDMQIIFQDPYASLNPRMTVAALIAEPLRVNQREMSKSEMQERVDSIMATVGLAPRLANAYPHELDGGRRQRIGIARALILEPKFIVCDEPVSALDVSIQAQILNLMMDIQEERGISYLFVTHDLSVVKHISDDIAVMYMGKLAEKASAEELFQNPLHPYTRALLSAIPNPNIKAKRREREILTGEVSSPIDPKPGCRFAPRCNYADQQCFHENPSLQEVAPGHVIACHHFEKGAN